MSHEIVTTCTRDCPSACGLIARVEGGQVVELKGNPDHPITGGRTCGKVRQYLKRVYDPARVVHPLWRNRSGEWTRISWDQALDEIAERLVTLRSGVGPESILYYQGFGTRTALQLLNERFFNTFGGVTTLRGTLCGGTGEASQNLDFGRRQSHDPLDHRHARTLILWGRNPAATQPPLIPVIDSVRRAGGMAILIDPVASDSLQVVDRFIQPPPGRDVWLALAVAARILERREEATEFLRDRTEGASAYRDLVQRFSVAQLLTWADVSLEEVDLLADRLVHHRPAAILLGWGLHRHRDAHFSIRAIDALSAVSGNIGISGGGVSQGFDEYGPYTPDAKGAHLCPPRRRFSMPQIGREILTASAPPIELIFVTAGNPVNMAPNTRMVRQAFESTPFVVTCGHYKDDTGEVSNLLLPTTSFLEEQDVVASYGHDVVGPVNRAISPIGEARSHYQIFSALAQRLGIPGFGESETTWLARLVAPLADKGISLDQVLAGPVRYGLPAVPFADGQFPTPSGRFRLVSQVGSPPSHTPSESLSTWPFTLLSVSPRHHLGSEWLPQDHAELPTVTLSPPAAAQLGLAEGQRVRVESPVGSLEARLLLDAHQRDDVALFPRGGWGKRGHGVNHLTVDQVSQVGEGAAYYDTRVRVIALDG